jgi:hypothetical protein
MYLDCYFYGAMLGDKFPVNSYGPASVEAIEALKLRVGHNFDRMEVVEETKGMNPLPADLWPGVDRPR